MNYRHIFHAGNSADVVKHTVLLLLLTALKEKDKGFCYIDTHAGCGIYDLTSTQANKTGEYKDGIALLTHQYQHPILQNYLTYISTIEKNHYPGSPWFARKMLRSQDKMVLNELQPDDNQTLKNLFKYDQQVSIHQRDAYEFLPAIVPPNPRRGLVLIDPPFEDFSERQKIITLMQKSYNKWLQGIYMIWLPLKDESSTKFEVELTNIPFKNNFTIKFFWQTTVVKANPMLGCSIVIFNLPFNAKEQLLALMSELKTALKVIKADFEVSFIEKENT